MCCGKLIFSVSLCDPEEPGSQGNVFVYDIFPKDAEVVIGGLAIDIGTTTVSAFADRYDKW